MKINIIRAILIILLLGTFFMIFGFSNQNAEKSGGLRTRVTEEVTKNIKPIQNLEKDQKENVLHRIESVIRKIAHFSIYTIVGLLLMSLLSTYPLKENIKIITSLGIGVLYAISDEVHQLFISGRSGQITDVLLDSMGVLLGIFLVLLVIKIITSNLLNKKMNINSY